MEELSIQYFRDLLDKHRKELKNYCQEWENSSTDKNIPEEVADEIRTTIGLTNLLLRQKLKQFGELIDDSELKRGEKEITCIDLEGFWDMVFHEVEKIQRSFQKLEKCQRNNWVFIEEPVLKLEAKKKPFKVAAKVTIQSKAHAIAARQRLAEAKQRMMDAKKKLKEAKNDVKQDVVVMESNSRENVSEEKTIDTKKQLTPVLVTVEDKESLNKVSKKFTSKSSKKTAQPQDVNGQQKRQKSERITKGKENLIESDKKLELLTVTAPKAPRTKRAKSPKEGEIPLQCVTRSARRAMLANQGN